MAYASLVRSTSGLFLLAALACSTADGLDTGGGGTGGPPPDPEPAPEPNGDACGLDLLSWETDCNFTGAISYENPLAPGELLELEPFEGTTHACCEGAPSVETANSACVDACVAELCRVAKNIYDQIADENGWSCVLGCEFDTEGCLAGISVQQFPTLHKATTIPTRSS